MSRRPRIAIDGAAGAGKSTLGRSLAAALGVPFLNTGAMYRSLTARALATGADLDDGEALAALARSIEFALDAGGEPPGLLIDGSRPGDDLSTPEVERSVSLVARHPPVRREMAEEQRRLAEGGAVVEGRDIGTVVLPDADAKIFLRASGGERAARRVAEREGPASELAAALARRDALDAKVNPLVAAPDAVEIDTEGRDQGEVLEEALGIVSAALAGKDLAAAPERAPERPRRRRLPRVAVVGRPNVGKSTLVNRLLGRRETIADAEPGVTRDRVEVEVSWRGRRFTVVDTGGYIPRGEGIDALVRDQADRAAREADAILFVVDAQTGTQQEDLDVARRLRRAEPPVIVVANKLDQPEPDPADVAPLYRLGLGEPVAVSSLHGYGSADLLDRLLAVLPETDGSEEDEEPDEARFAIVGRPNVGKSSLFNRLVGDERAVVHDLAGTTRDAVDSLVDVDGRTVRFVDTAGFRKRTRLEGVAYYGLVRALQAIDRSDVALLVIDASEGLTAEDKRIAARTAEAGRALVAAANKWDLVEAGERESRFLDLKESLAVFPGVPVLRTSALTGRGVDRLVPALLDAHATWSKRVPTAKVNEVLQAAQGRQPPKRGGGRPLYGAQVGTGPPRFVIFSSAPVDPGYRRYLENRLRTELGFPGVPIRIAFRQRRKRKR